MADPVSPTVSGAAGNWLGALRRFLRPPVSVERCELCGGEIRSGHPHLVETAKQRLLCACDPCALLFVRQDGQYRRVPRRVRRLEGFRLEEPQWESLDIPIDLAFFYFRSSDRRVVAIYPGPAGTVERPLEPQTWSRLLEGNPVLAELEPDVEALLVNRMVDRPGYYRVPIDRCYVLAGLIRRHWQGLSGGSEVWKRIRDYFAWLDGEPDTLGEWTHG